MKKAIVLSYCFLFFSSAYAQEEEPYKEYSYTEFFELIEEETDTIFKLEKAVIRFNEEQDTSFFLVPQWDLDTAYCIYEVPRRIVDKQVRLTDVYFEQKSLFNDELYPMGIANAGYISNVEFKKQLKITGCSRSMVFPCNCSAALQMVGLEHQTGSVSAK